MENTKFAASGTYSVLGRGGSFDVAFELTDRNAAATSGPCTMTNGDETLTGTYSISGATISFSYKNLTVTASLDAENVILQVSGYPKGRIAG